MLPCLECELFLLFKFLLESSIVFLPAWMDLEESLMLESSIDKKWFFFDFRLFEREDFLCFIPSKDLDFLRLGLSYIWLASNELPMLGARRANCIWISLLKSFC